MPKLLLRPLPLTFSPSVTALPPLCSTSRHELRNLAREMKGMWVLASKDLLQPRTEAVQRLLAKAFEN